MLQRWILRYAYININVLSIPGLPLMAAGFIPNSTQVKASETRENRVFVIFIRLHLELSTTD